MFDSRKYLTGLQALSRLACTVVVGRAGTPARSPVLCGQILRIE